MLVSKTAPDVKARWNAKSYDAICVYVKKGKKEIIKKRAEEVVPSKSINGYINKLIDDDLKRD